MVHSWTCVTSVPLVFTLTTIVVGWFRLVDINSKLSRLNPQIQGVPIVTAHRTMGSANLSLKAHTTGPQKVLIFAYMRSGSTFVGEMSRQNPKHIFWFEPVDSMYSHLYGTRLGWSPLDISYFVNGSKRTLPLYEREFLRDSMLDLLNCNFDKVPLDVLAARKRNGNNSWPFSSCRTAEFLKSNDYNNRRSANIEVISRTTSEKDKIHYLPDRMYKDISQCKGPLQHQCPRRFTGTTSDRLVQCHHALHSQNRNNFARKGYIEKLKQSTYNECISKYNAITNKCLHHLYKQCPQSEANTVKTIRLTMDTVEDILAKDQTVKVIYLLRDPRAIVTSRVGSLMSGVARFKSKRHEIDELVVHEAQMLCSKMMDDITKSKVLTHRFPGQILEVRYEDVAKRPVEVFRSFYEFLQLDNFQVIEDWFREVSQTLADGTKFDTKRNNSTKTAANWQRKITLWRAKAMGKVCPDVMHYLGLKE